MKKTVIALLVPFVLIGCSSIKTSNEFEMKAPSFANNKPDEGDEVKYPSWYTKEEKPWYKFGDDKSNSYVLKAVASEFSKDFQFAVDKSMLSAKRELAGHYSSYISAMMKDFSAEIGESGDVVREIDRTTKLVIAQVNLVGVQRENFEVRHERNGYRAFVKLSYTTSDANKILVNEIKRNRQLSAKAQKSKAFRELEESVNNINGSRDGEIVE